jgi:hypothetical protein
MSVINYSARLQDLKDWEFNGRPVRGMGVISEDMKWPYPIQGGVLARYVQKCVDTVSGVWVSWATNYQDIYGNEYPGTGFDPGTYRIETISYMREQT